MNTEIELYSDESLESFLLRLSKYRGYERFAHFAEDIWHETLLQHDATPGAFPFELSRINLFKAQTTSQMRVRVLLDLEKQLSLDNFGILRLVLANSKVLFSPEQKALHRSGIDYPYVFLRKNSTPICPECLKEAPYIRQLWHFMPYQVCHKHQCKLVHRCPQCGKTISYQQSELIESCECGYRFTACEAEKPEQSALIVAQWLAGSQASQLGLLSHKLSLSSRFGFLLWYVNRFGDTQDISFDDFVDCCETWPQCLNEDLDSIVHKADLIRTLPWNKAYFREVFGELLKECCRLPYRELSKNPVLLAVVQYFTLLVSHYPRSKSSNIADILVSPLEAAALFSCTSEEIIRLYQFGELKAQIKPKLHSKLEKHQSVFTLRSIIEFKLANMRSEEDGTVNFLPEW